ncbi:MAG: hypothetical protein C0524_15415 [Rhodobacter sp.]|nr:hypothetical protein [Rhodobacter sp.]
MNPRCGVSRRTLIWRSSGIQSTWLSQGFRPNSTEGAPADLFGFIGTADLLIERTVLSLAVPRSLLRRIAEEEKPQPLPVC